MICFFYLKQQFNLLLFFLTIPLLLLVFCSCNRNKINESIKIGDKTWAIKNLTVNSFRNGDSIPEAKTEEEWGIAWQDHKPAWCYYENDPKNGEIYGKLYNWFAVNDIRGLAPKGWHIPSKNEWEQLRSFLGLDEAGKKIKSNNGWLDNGNGTNESGLSALPGGVRYAMGAFDYIGYLGFWWTTSPDQETTNYIYCIKMSCSRNNIVFETQNYGAGLSVYCVKD